MTISRRDAVVGAAAGAVAGLMTLVVVGRRGRNDLIETGAPIPTTELGASPTTSAPARVTRPSPATLPPETTSALTTNPPATSAPTTAAPTTAAPTSPPPSTTTPPPASPPEPVTPADSTVVQPIGQAPSDSKINPPPTPPPNYRPDPGTPDVPSTWTEHTIGTSFGGRPILAYDSPSDSPRRRVLIVSGIHGNESITLPLARQLMHEAIPAAVAVTIVPSANPDGWAANSRYNDNRVDLNRNFAWRWADYDGGAAPASEPETVALMNLVNGDAWDAVVWIHQPLGYVAAVPPTPQLLADLWRSPGGLDTRADLDQHGGAETWTAKVAGRNSLLVEADSWDATQAMVDRHRAGYLALLAHLAAQ